MDAFVKDVEKVVEEPSHSMAIMDGSGDTVLTWDTDQDADIAVARTRFDELRAIRYVAYAFRKAGGEGEMIDVFDPSVERIILAPPMAGG